ncbi:hypothetical protein [Bradyrhizobium sp. NAS96.2]|uniref:hypothetical protein n=1 Tax=Bradyrhizobium sp. NAS96.2 TaxID=1680160 RepID=UPI0011613549|nr:hypothetical protein [Bradyrhizobium sp. NAS96.2]
MDKTWGQGQGKSHHLALWHVIGPVRFGSALSVFIHVALEKQTEGTLEVFKRAMASFFEVMDFYLISENAEYLQLRAVVRDVDAPQ